MLGAQLGTSSHHRPTRGTRKQMAQSASFWHFNAASFLGILGIPQRPPGILGPLPSSEGDGAPQRVASFAWEPPQSLCVRGIGVNRDRGYSVRVHEDMGVHRDKGVYADTGEQGCMGYEGS